MISRAKTTKRLIPAASYIRMSGRKQERSPAQQKAEIVKLAAREGCEIIRWFQDDAITGDSGPDQRPGFRALLAAAQRGEFKVLLAYDQDRIGRFDSMDAGQWLAPLRAAGVTIITCVQGRIDLESSGGRIIFTVNQEAKKQFLIELSGKVVRGQTENAAAGFWNGGPVPYAFDRAEFTKGGQFVRRLLGKARADQGNRVGLVPTEDAIRLEAARYAFERYDTADISARRLARELAAKGCPGPTGNGWSGRAVEEMLANPVYCGTRRWGERKEGKYNRPEETVLREKSNEGIVPVDQFERVQRRLTKRSEAKRGDRADYPLSGLLVCKHCGKVMHGNRITRRSNNKTYVYLQYLCATYDRYAKDPIQNTTCGYFTIRADRVLRWVTAKIKEFYLGPGRDALRDWIRGQLEAESKGGDGERTRLEKRARELDAEVGRLVKAIRTMDAPELMQELSAAKSERQAVQDALQRAGRLIDPENLDAEADATVDRLWTLGERLDASDPALLREVLHEAVEKIVCEWTTKPRSDGKTATQLVGGTVVLTPCGPFPVLSGGENHARPYLPNRLGKTSSTRRASSSWVNRITKSSA